LKSALKKTAVNKIPKTPLKSAMKKPGMYLDGSLMQHAEQVSAADPGKGYQSESEAVKRTYGTY